MKVHDAMDSYPIRDWFELCLEKYPDLPSIVLLRSIELKLFPRRFLKPPVLDLCCGDGFFGQALGLRGAYGCDIDERAVQAARGRENTYSEVRTSDARDLAGVRSGSFNSVIANCSLEHVEGVDRALSSAARVLKPGGSLIMSVPTENLNRWFFPYAVFNRLGLAGYGRRLCEEYNRKQQHVNICPVGHWDRKLRESGLATERHFYLFTEKEYRLITFFESFTLASFPGGILAGIDRAFRKGLPVKVRKSLWRTVLKTIYVNARELESGGELFIVARKR